LPGVVPNNCSARFSQGSSESDGFLGEGLIPSRLPLF
jgi:hypothetical protein